MDNNNILITVSNLKMTSGVSSFWNALFRAFESFDDMRFKPLEIGGHGKNLLGPLYDQWKFYRAMKRNIKLAFINPSLLNRSFFRDAFFIKQLLWKNIPFVVFFHGWELDFEAVVDAKYINFFMKTYGKAEKIFVLSEDFKNKIVEWGYEGEVIVETTNADIELINDYTFEERLDNMDNATPLKILFLARLIHEKGVFELLEAVKILTKKGENIELIVAGNGEDFESLKTLVGEMKNVRLTGDVQGEDKIALFKECHIYALPSYYGEGLPTSVLEAMLFGMPVLTSEAGGLKYFFQNEKMGYLVPTKNPHTLAEKIEELISDNEKMLEISKYNFIYAQEHVTNIVMAKRLHDELKELM